MAESIAFNIDCMEYLKTVPDKYFDLAVCDPPYGGGSSQTVNVERERETDERGTDSADGSTGTRKPLRFHGGDRWNKYINLTAGGENTVARTGGTWAEKYGKKSLRGTLPRRKSISTKSFASHAIR